MKNSLVIADAGPIFSLALVNQLHILTEIFADVRISEAVWSEITLDKTTPIYDSIYQFFYEHVSGIQSFNDLTFIMDFGEAESVILYKELNADFLLIDDKKARRIAESLGVNCIGTLGLLSLAKDKGFITALRPIFQKFQSNGRYYSVELLNALLVRHNEKPFT